MQRLLEIRRRYIGKRGMGTILAFCCAIALTYGCITIYARHHSAELQRRRVMLQMCHNELVLSSGYLSARTIVNDQGTATCSWRFACYQGVRCGPADREPIDLTIPWHDERRTRWRALRPPEYCFADDPTTNVMAVAGEGTAFQEGREYHCDDLPGDLIMLIEVEQTGIHWMAPVDLDISELEDSLVVNKGAIRLGTSHDGFFIVFLDGEAWMLSHTIPWDVLKRFCSRDEATRADRDEILSPFRVF